VAFELDSITTDEPIYRVGRAPDAWSWPDWRYAQLDGTFGNRWDDHRGVYRVLYASSQRSGAFLEALQQHRPASEVASAIDEIVVNHDDGADGSLPPGRLSADWIERTLMVGEAFTDAVFADVGTARSLSVLRREFLGRARELGLDDLDAAAIRLKAPRALTQEISRYVYELAHDDGTPAFGGVQYASRLGDEFANWAIFEPADSSAAPLDYERRFSVDRDDDDLLTALEILEVRLV
jgi:RES domain